LTCYCRPHLEAKLENPDFVDQQRAAVLARLVQLRRYLCRQGAVVRTRRRRRGGDAVAGPYFAVAYRDDEGRQRSVYLGPESYLVADVRELLAEYRRPLREQRDLARVRAALRRALRTERAKLDRQLAKVGLARKGAEIRGWRSACAYNSSL
jgi:hypothetical protein